MAASARVVDNLPRFTKNLIPVIDDALREAGRDTLILAKKRAPFEKGGLRSNADLKQVSQLNWRVSFWQEYARFQEFGGDAKRKVRNYSTPGTGKRYLKSSGDEQAKKFTMTLKKHLPRVRV